ncbi:MAG: endonuclease domain-containing protein [Clostridia bacterium]|nr:endonuclease domain-containing protein [Clostridia bacterium]
MSRIYLYDHQNKRFAQKLRREMTPQERFLWYGFLKTCSAQFRRQKQFGPYIADFYCADAKLVIELDGSQHYEGEAIASDQERDAYLSGLGLLVLRYSNADVNRNFKAVCEDIMKYLK